MELEERIKNLEDLTVRLGKAIDTNAGILAQVITGVNILCGKKGVTYAEILETLKNPSKETFMGVRVQPPRAGSARDNPRVGEPAIFDSKGNRDASGIGAGNGQPEGSEIDQGDPTPNDGKRAEGGEASERKVQENGDSEAK